MKVSKNKTMTLESVIHLSKGKPKRPLSAYNIFYRLSREHLILSFSQGRNNVMETAFDEITRMKKETLMAKCSDIIKDYRNDNYSKPKYSHNLKTLGSMVGFQDLTRVIAKKWAKLTPSTRAVLESCSKEDRKIYVQKRNLWKKLKDAKIKLKLDQQLIQDEDPNKDDFIRPCDDSATNSDVGDSRTNAEIECNLSTDNSFGLWSTSCPDSRNQRKPNRSPIATSYPKNPVHSPSSGVTNKSDKISSDDHKSRISYLFSLQSTKSTGHSIKGQTKSTLKTLENESYLIKTMDPMTSSCETNLAKSCTKHPFGCCQKLCSSGTRPSFDKAENHDRKSHYSFFQLGQRYARYHMSISSVNLNTTVQDSGFNHLRQCLLMDVFDYDDNKLNHFFSNFHRKH